MELLDTLTILICAFTVIVHLIILGFSIKFYTEYFKEKVRRDR